jgi:hypothetical protein
MQVVWCAACSISQRQLTVLERGRAYDYSTRVASWTACELLCLLISTILKLEFVTFPKYRQRTMQQGTRCKSGHNCDVTRVAGSLYIQHVAWENGPNADRNPKQLLLEESVTPLFICRKTVQSELQVTVWTKYASQLWVGGGGQKTCAATILWSIVHPHVYSANNPVPLTKYSVLQRGVSS